MAAANASIAPFTGHPSPFPVDTPLGKKLPAGTKIAFLQCSTPICGLVSQLLAPAVKTLGGKFVVVNAGSTAAASQAAASSVLALKPAAVVLSGIQPSEFGGALKRLSAAGIKVVSISVADPNVHQYGIEFNYVGLPPLARAGRLMADWVIVHKGPKANVVFYGIPELNFSSYMQQAFEQELASKCPSCKVRAVPISITTLGSTAPQTVVTDLQSHTDTNTAVFASSEIAAGLPAALKTAGLSITTFGYSPEPAELQYIKDGQMTGGLAVDFPTQLWTSADIVARLLLHEHPTPGEVAGVGPFQFLGPKDITFNPAKGWTGYPDFPVRFAKLWHAAP